MTLSAVVSASVGGAVLVDLTSRASTLSFGTNEHGFATLDAFYPCSLLEAFTIYDRAGLPHVAVTDNSTTVWEGRLEDVAIIPGGVRLKAFGYQRALSDTLYIATHTSAATSSIAAALVANVSSLNSTQLSTSTVLVSTNALAVTETYNDMRPADILSRIASYGDTSGNVWEWGVYDQRVLYFRQRGTVGRAWYVDATELTLERSINNLYNSVYAIYTNGTNAASRTTIETNSDSVSRYGIFRQAFVNSKTLNSSMAEYQATTFLTDSKDATPRAQIAFSSVYDASGGKWPLYMVRAGDTITIRNLPPTISTTVDKIRTFYVSRTEYSADSDTLSVEPTSYTPTIENQVSALESRISQVENDDGMYYETGTWMPSFAGTGTAGVFTYAAQVGFYTRVGRLVFYHGYIAITAIGTPPVGNMRISGLPFTVENTSSNYSPASFGFVYNFNFTAGALGLTGYTLPNTTQLYLEEFYDNAASNAIPAANFTNAACQLIFGGVYQTA